MKIFLPLFFIVLCGVDCQLFSFAYDSAMYAAQKGDVQKASDQLNRMIIDDPDKSDLLYDAGIMAHDLNKFDQAAAYFSRAADCAGQDKKLCFQSHFNAGNACVAQKKLECALEEYNKALALEPDNEYARHNRDRVAQMIEEQENKQDQQQDQQQNKDQEQQEKDKQQNQQQDGQDQQSGEDGNDQKDGNNEQQNKDQKGKPQDGSDQSDQRSQGQDGDDSQDSSKGAAGDQQRNDKQQQKDGKKDHERDGKEKPQENLGNDKQARDKQNGQQHKKASDEGGKDKTNSTIPSQKESNQANAAERSEKEKTELQNRINDPWLVSILDEQEGKDQAINKQLMEAKIRQNGGSHGQNCW